MATKEASELEKQLFGIVLIDEVIRAGALDGTIKNLEKDFLALRKKTIETSGADDNFCKKVTEALFLSIVLGTCESIFKYNKNSIFSSAIDEFLNEVRDLFQGVKKNEY